MLKITKSNLKKIEHYISENGYKIIYEKGHFKSGYCIVNQSNVIVVNKFFNLEGRINALIEIVPQLSLSEGLFDMTSDQIMEEINKKLNFSE